MFPKSKEKGQGLVEYALILVLVAIVVISALMILGPVIGNVFSKVNIDLAVAAADTDVSRSLLSEAPMLDYKASNPSKISLANNERVYVPVEAGCETYPTYGNRVKVGTPYQHPEEISVVMLSDKEFKVCSNATGATVHLVIAFFKPLQ